MLQLGVQIFHRAISDDNLHIMYRFSLIIPPPSPFSIAVSWLEGLNKIYDNINRLGVEKK